jgi:hypothetical protein
MTSKSRTLIIVNKHCMFITLSNAEYLPVVALMIGTERFCCVEVLVLRAFCCTVALTSAHNPLFTMS